MSLFPKVRPSCRVTNQRRESGGGKGLKRGWLGLWRSESEKWLSSQHDCQCTEGGTCIIRKKEKPVNSPELSTGVAGPVELKWEGLRKGQVSLHF